MQDKKLKKLLNDFSKENSKKIKTDEFSKLQKKIEGYDIRDIDSKDIDLSLFKLLFKFPVFNELLSSLIDKCNKEIITPNVLKVAIKLKASDDIIGFLIEKGGNEIITSKVLKFAIVSGVCYESTIQLARECDESQITPGVLRACKKALEKNIVSQDTQDLLIRRSKNNKKSNLFSRFFSNICGNKKNRFAKEHVDIEERGDNNQVKDMNPFMSNDNIAENKALKVPDIKSNAVSEALLKTANPFISNDNIAEDEALKTQDIENIDASEALLKSALGVVVITHKNQETIALGAPNAVFHNTSTTQLNIKSTDQNKI